MKYLLLLFLVISCNKDQVCKSLDDVVGLAASAVSMQFECNSEKVLVSLMAAKEKVKLCVQEEKGVIVSGLNSIDLKCVLAPMLAKVIGDEASKDWECKQVGSSLEDMLKQALKCG